MRLVMRFDEVRKSMWLNRLDKRQRRRFKRHAKRELLVAWLVADEEALFEEGGA